MSLVVRNGIKFSPVLDRKFASPGDPYGRLMETPALVGSAKPEGSRISQVMGEAVSSFAHLVPAFEREAVSQLLKPPTV